MNARSRLAVWLFTALAVVVILAVALAPTVLSWRLRMAVSRSFAGSPQVSVQGNAPRRAVLRLDGGVITIEGDVRLGVVDLRVRMEGRLVVASPTTVDLYVQTLTVSGVQIPREIGSVLVSSLNPLITLDGMPVPMRIESVAVEGGQVRLSVRIGETS